jgi:hypothetical protein
MNLTIDLSEQNAAALSARRRSMSVSPAVFTSLAMFMTA